MKPVTKVKLDAAGQHLPDDAPEWVAVFLPDHGITFSRDPVTPKRMSQKKLEEKASALKLMGEKGWDLAEIDEMELIIDRTRRDPAIDTNYFPNIPADWFWTKTALVGSPSCAWSVDFDGGFVNASGRYGLGFGLAVRRVGQ